MKLPACGWTECLQVGFCVCLCGVFKINRSKRRGGGTGRRGLLVNVSGFGWIKQSLNYMLCLLQGVNSKRKNCAWHLRTNAM